MSTEPGLASPSKRRLAWFEIAAAIVAACLLAFLALGLVVEAASAHYRNRGGSQLGELIGAAVCVALVVACGLWALHAEHRLRGHTPVAASFVSTPRASRVRYGPRRRYGPVSATFILLLFLGAFVACVIGAISEHSQAERSSYVQAHGTTATGSVTGVDNTQHCGRGGCSYTSAIGVDMGSKVDGTSFTTVHYPGYSDLVSGQPVSLLVDPKQPSYAEFAGAPFAKTSSWIILVAFAVFAGILLLIFARQWLRLMLHRAGYGRAVA